MQESIYSRELIVRMTMTVTVVVVVVVVSVGDSS